MAQWSSRTTLLAVAVLALLSPARAAAQPILFTTFSASGVSPADIQPTIDQFRAALGGGMTPGPNGSFSDATGARREITWDDVPAPFAAPNDLPANYYNTISPRGVTFVTGTGGRFQVSGAPTDMGTPGQPAAANFANINPTYGTQFQSFSDPRLFATLGTSSTSVGFFVPGTNMPGLTGGFGAVFTDVDQANSTLITLFGPRSEQLGSFPVPPSLSGGLSFLGIFANSGTPIGGVVIRTSAGLGPFVNDVSNFGTADLVAMDNFIYAEPIPIPEPSSLALLGLSAAGLMAGRLWRRRAIRGATAFTTDNALRS